MNFNFLQFILTKPLKSLTTTALYSQANQQYNETMASSGKAPGSFKWNNETTYSHINFNTQRLSFGFYWDLNIRQMNALHRWKVQTVTK